MNASVDWNRRQNCACAHFSWRYKTGERATFIYLFLSAVEEGDQVLETIRIQSNQHPTATDAAMPQYSTVIDTETPADSHPSWWIQDFLHSTLGIARKKRSPQSADLTGQDAGGADPASTSGQIQLWQVKFSALRINRLILKSNYLPQKKRNSFYWNCWPIRNRMPPGSHGKAVKANSNWSIRMKWRASGAHAKPNQIWITTNSVVPSGKTTWQRLNYILKSSIQLSMIQKISDIITTRTSWVK